MDSARDVLDRVKRTREADDRRRFTVARFRRSTERSLYRFGIWLAFAAVQFLRVFAGNFPRASIAGLFDSRILSVLVGMLALLLALRELYVSPRDRLLLLLAEEKFENDGQDQATSGGERSSLSPDENS